MAKRRRFSRWRRLPTVYRFGDEKPVDPNLEPERVTLFISGREFDLAQEQARRMGHSDVQAYCLALVKEAIEAERVNDQVADVEARRGPLKGLRQISDDPEYLAELSAAPVSPRHSLRMDEDREDADIAYRDISVRVDDPNRHEVIIEEAAPEKLALEPPNTQPEDAGLALERVSEDLGNAARVVLRHAGESVDGDDPQGFLPSLRRGESVSEEKVAELAGALQELEREAKGTWSMDRRLTFALHRLAFESQILHTDAWPGTFDAWTVDMLRAVQEAVERILSGQDIRYYPSENDGRNIDRNSSSMRQGNFL